MLSSFVLLMFLITGCSPIMPPEYLVTTNFTVPYAKEFLSQRCPDLLTKFLKNKHSGNAVFSLERSYTPDVIACTVYEDINTSYQWNVLLESSNATETRISIHRFIRSKFKCIPLSTGKDEKEFINFLTKALKKTHG